MQPGLSTNTPMVHPGIATQPYRLVMAFSDAPAYRLPASITRRQAELSRRLFALSERVQGTFRDRVLIQTRYSVAKPTDSRSRESVSKPPAPPRGAALRPDSRTGSSRNKLQHIHVALQRVQCGCDDDCRSFQRPGALATTSGRGPCHCAAASKS